eukprot:2499550-Amphidinium_carterae.1
MSAADTFYSESAEPQSDSLSGVLPRCLPLLLSCCALQELPAKPTAQTTGLSDKLLLEKVAKRSKIPVAKPRTACKDGELPEASAVGIPLVKSFCFKGSLADRGAAVKA